MEREHEIPEDHRRRSDFIKNLVQHPFRGKLPPSEYSYKIPRTIAQFWHNRAQLPSDVSNCMQTWEKLKTNGFNYVFFDQEDAKEFIDKELGERYVNAFKKCYHPAMQSDYFRLCYISIKGGFYVDADDVYLGVPIDDLFVDSRLKIQPLCYDLASGLMVEPRIFSKDAAYSPNWIFYFNNNPLIAPPHHIIIDEVLAQSTILLENSASTLPEIQSTTGPGILSKSIFKLGIEKLEIESNLHILSDWENTAFTKWQLSYRNDSRNWRISNQKQHQG